MSLIFELDLTLIDSTPSDAYRKARQWNQVYALIPKFSPYEGIRDVLAKLAERQVPYAIVTTSPRPYCEKVCAHWGITPVQSVCYHDVSYGQLKPHPASMLKALTLLKASPAGALSFGDRDIDILASNAAGIPSVACLWGTASKESLLAAKPTFIIEKPMDILSLAEQELGLKLS